MIYTHGNTNAAALGVSIPDVMGLCREAVS
jgi:hypothetical protein